MSRSRGPEAAPNNRPAGYAWPLRTYPFVRSRARARFDADGRISEHT